MRRILLVADAGGDIGWGHAMRMLAVAEELAGRSGVQAVWLTTTPAAVRQLKPPCPVELVPNTPEVVTRTSDAFLVDLSAPNPGWPTEGVWYMVDHGVGLEGTNRICPHFGAEGRDWGPGAVVCGPRWMPLRKEIVGWTDLPEDYARYDPAGGTFAYRAPMEIQDAHHLTEGERWWERKWSLAIVPPSTIAYECMALGIPIALLPLPNDQPDDVGVAMHDAGVARALHRDGRYVDTYMAERARAAVDGRGVERVADLLERW